MLGIVGIAGDEVNEAGVEQTMRGAFGGAAEVAQKRLGGDLNEAAAGDVLPEVLGVVLEEGIPLGVGNDGNKAGANEFEQGLLSGLEGGVFGQFHHQVLVSVNGVFLRVAKGIVEIGEFQVEVATEM